MSFFEVQNESEGISSEVSNAMKRNFQGEKWTTSWTSQQQTNMKPQNKKMEKEVMAMKDPISLLADTMANTKLSSGVEEQVPLSAPIPQVTNIKFLSLESSELNPWLVDHREDLTSQGVSPSPIPGSSLFSANGVSPAAQGKTGIPRRNEPATIEEELSNQNLYKTELCRSWKETGDCRYGLKCQFAHGEHELRLIMRHPKYKTEPCKTYATNGYCKYGDRCRFLHPQDSSGTSVRVPKPTPSPSPIQGGWSTSWTSPASHGIISPPPGFGVPIQPSEPSDRVAERRLSVFTNFADEQ